jgi:signal peptide peptidase SppA
MNKYVMWAIDPKNKPSMSELRDAFSESDDKLLRRHQSRGYYSVKIGSVGVVPVKDALYNSDYIRISSMIDELNNDPEVTKILLDINSPGGVVNGAIECASTISKNRKPVYAYIEGMGCSAAYLLASASKKILMSPASEAGSIGVQASWTNMDGFWSKLGIQKVYFHSKYSDKKNLSPGTKEGKEAEQKLLDETWDLFAGAICKHRGITVEELVEKYGQGEVFLAKEALERGLVDEIVDDFDACVELIKPQGNWGEGEGVAEQETITTVEALTAAYPELVAQIKRDERKAGVEEGQKAERTRAESIMSLSAHVTDISVIAEGIKGGKTKEAVMSDILDAQAAEKEKAAKDAQSALEAAAKDSANNIVPQGTLADDGLVADEEEAKKAIDAMAKNVEGAK